MSYDFIKSLQPMSKEAMNQFIVDRTQKEVENIIATIYYPAVQVAKGCSKQVYHYAIPKNDVFYTTNMDKILSKLRELFPGCVVSHTLLSRGSNGKLYDISKIKDDELKLVSTVNENSYIVIDWS